MAAALMGPEEMPSLKGKLDWSQRQGETADVNPNGCKGRPLGPAGGKEERETVPSHGPSLGHWFLIPAQRSSALMPHHGRHSSLAPISIPGLSA